MLFEEMLYDDDAPPSQSATFITSQSATFTTEQRIVIVFGIDKRVSASVLGAVL